MAARAHGASPTLVALGIVLVLILGALGWYRLGPYGMSQAQAEAEVERLGGGGEYFHLGEQADGHHLANISFDPEGGRMIFEYGRCMDNDEGRCNRPLNVISVPKQDAQSDPSGNGDCVSIQEVMSEGQIVVVSASTVEITYWEVVSDGYMTDFDRSKALVPQLRAVGQAAPSICPRQRREPPEAAERLTHPHSLLRADTATWEEGAAHPRGARR